MPVSPDLIHTPWPGWHGIPPSADRFRSPVTLNEPPEEVTEPEKALPIWLELNGHPLAIVSCKQ